MRRSNFIVKFFYLLINIITLNAAFLAGFAIRFYSLDQATIFINQQYHILLIFLNLALLVISARDHVFTEFETISTQKVFRTVVVDTISIVLSLFIFIVVLKGYQYSRQFHLLFATFLFLGMMLSRLAYFGILTSVAFQRIKNRKILIVCDESSVEHLLSSFKTVLQRSIKQIELFVYGIDAPRFVNGMTLKPATEILKNGQTANDEILIFYNDRAAPFFSDLIDRAENLGMRVRLIPGFFRLRMSDIIMEKDYGLPLLRFRPEPLENINNYLLKRIFDIVFATTIMLTVYPILLLIVGPLIKLSSRGPIHFRQLRTGHLNNEFFCLKFRSMRPNEDADKMQATKHDPRITWIGRLLRRTNLDEFPQFWNVIKGEMSVVGPRPHMIRHTEEYSQIIDKYKVRHFCRPGITGWAQVNGYRGETDDPELMKKRVEYDIWYIENWSFWLDIKIIFMTLFYMIRGQERAY